VRRLSHEEMVQVNQLSAMIEDELLAAGVPKMTPEHKAEMLEAAEMVAREGGNKREVLAAHRRLHFIPFEASGLNIFLDVVNRLWDQYEHYRLLFFDSDMAFKSSAMDEHQRFAQACVDGDAELARRIHAQHRLSSFRHLARIADE
jgi:DNA-binding GntR family transcriptional regulator